MNRILLYTFIDFGKFKSGSAVRPQMMDAAFRELGLEVVLLQTQQNKRKERRRAVAEMNAWLDGHTADYCYVESPSGVIMNRCDRKLIKRIKRIGMGTALFYRDAYFLLPKSTRAENSFLKSAVLDFLCRLDLRLYRKTMDIVYFPSGMMADQFRFPRKGVLPPACNMSFVPSEFGGRNCIYVGGLGTLYGSDTLLTAFTILNSGAGPEYLLTLVCRKEEANRIPGEFLRKPWLTVRHESGAGLAELYRQANLALIPKRRSFYNDFAISVKLYEYMGYGLPIVATDCVEAAKVIRDNGMGVVTQDNPEAFAAGVREILSDPVRYESARDNTRRAVAENNLWIHRARKVLEDADG